MTFNEAAVCSRSGVEIRANSRAFEVGVSLLRLILIDDKLQFETFLLGPLKLRFFNHLADFLEASPIRLGSEAQKIDEMTSTSSSYCSWFVTVSCEISLCPETD